MVSVSTVWDRATDVVRGRAGQMGGIAALTLFLPGLVRNAVPLALAPGSVGFAAATGLVAIAAGLVSVWGQLALLATASDPRVTRDDALALASRRFPAALAVTIVAVLAVFATLIPAAFAVAASGADLAGLEAGQWPAIGRGALTFLLLYALALAIGGLWVGARLFLTNAVVVNERHGLRAFARSWQLTRGLTWRLVGVLLLYLVVAGIAVSAAQLITGSVFGLLLGRTATVTFLAAGAGLVVSTVFSILAAAFVGQLYVAVTDRGVATVFE